MSDQLQIRAELANGRMMYKALVQGFPPLISDYPAPFGDNQGPCSLELFLVSLATCVGNSVCLLLQKMHKSVAGLTIQARGNRRSEHPTSFESIVLEMHFIADDVTQADFDKAIAISEDRLCPVWNMIKGNVVVRVQAKIEPVTGSATK